MKSRFWFIATAALVVVASMGAGIALAYHQGMYVTLRAPLEMPQEQLLSPRANEAIPNAVIAKTVSMTPFSYQPRTIVVNRGEAIRFVNAGIARQRPMSDPHPAHDKLVSLNADGFVAPGRSWYAVMDQPGTFQIHDEVYPQVQATVIVN